MKTIKDYKINISSYLSIATIDALDEIAREENSSRNSIIEKAISSFLAKTNKKKDSLSFN